MVFASFCFCHSERSRSERDGNEESAFVPSVFLCILCGVALLSPSARTRGLH